MKTSSLVIAAAVAAIAAIPALADSGIFTDRSLNGSYGFSGSGTILLPPDAGGGAIPAAAVGIMTFDGDGGCVITDTINVGGRSFPQRESDLCDYEVNEDGSGTINAAFIDGPVPLSFVLVEGGRGFHWIRTDAGVARGTAERQGRPRHHDD